jgi:DHA2 family multidrug resistance protein
MITRNLLLIAVIAAAMMELIDISIVNVALSHMSGNLGSTLEDTSWVITSYAIANVIIIPITSFLAAFLGRRNYYIGSIIAFAFFSLMCGQATNIWELVAFRFLQGLGGGALLSVSQAIVFELFPKEKQNVAAAIFGIGIFIGPTIGPTLGGFITEYYSWPWIFYINVPLGIMVATICFLLLKESVNKPVIGKVDWLGIFLLAIGVSALQTVLERGETEDWFETGYIVVLAVIAFFGLILFVWWELKTPHPVVNLRVLKSRNLSIAAILTFISGIGMFSSVFLTPVFAQRLLGFTPTQTGLLLLPGAILAISGLMVSARLLQKGLSPLYLIFTGICLFVLFSWLMSGMNLQANAAGISAALVFRGMGLAIITVPLTTLAVSALRPVDIPQGAALNNMMRQLGGSFGLALVNTYLHIRTSEHRSDIVSHITADNSFAIERLSNYTDYFMSKGFTQPRAHQQAIQAMENVVFRQSSQLSYSDTYLVVGLIFLCSLPMLLFAAMKKGEKMKVILTDH